MENTDGISRVCRSYQDRRRIHLKITPEAAPVIEDITKVQNDYWNIMFEGFSEEEYRTYEKLRSRHFENVRRAEERRR